MKKRFMALVLALLLAAVWAIPTFAAESSTVSPPAECVNHNWSSWVIQRSTYVNYGSFHMRYDYCNRTCQSCFTRETNVMRGPYREAHTLPCAFCGGRSRSLNKEEIA